MIFSLKTKLFIVYLFLGILFSPSFSFAQEEINLNGPDLLPKSEIFFSPSSADFLIGSTFDVPIYINTRGNSINTVNVKLSFDASKLSIVKPSGGKSILGIWLEPPSYDNKNGTASFVGVIPNGITTSSGLIATITFKAISVGDAHVGITDFSSANLNDGVGSNVKLSLGRATYHINPKIPEGVVIYSETHPFQDHWYNNNSPVLSWDTPAGLNGFSTFLDTNPNTVPDAIIKDKNSSASFTNLNDGVWYFHVRSNVNGVWGNASHFQIRIDTSKPAFFAPTIDVLNDTNKTKKYLLSFITTDPLSSIDHYEVGVIDKSEENISSPVFIQSESPYLISGTSKNTHVIIRAYDVAGNVREVSVDLYPGVTFVMMLKKYALYLFMIITFLLLLELILHYLFGHHIISHLKRMFYIFGKISSDEKYKEIEKEIEKIDNTNTQNTDKNP